jgi:hypothetical protein
LLISLASTLLVWGVCLGPSVTLSPEAVTAGINPNCRVGTSQLACKAGFSQNVVLDAGAPVWVNIPADYFFRRARLRGEPRPHWNPYTGSGYPIALDGHNSGLSPTQWFLSHVPGDQGRDIVVFIRFALWTFAITWLVALRGATAPLLVGVALSAALAPYGAQYVDITFLDVDLLGPWFLLILLGFSMRRLSLRTAAGLSVALGVLVGVMAFQQAQVVLCIAMGVLALAAAPFTRARSLILVACLGLGVLAVFPSWLPLLRNLDQFVSSRSIQCVAEIDTGVRDFWEHVLHPPATDDPVAFVTAVGAGLLLFVPGRAWFVVIALLAIGTWTVLGLPHAACSLPVISGIRFSRHFIPHLQMLFIAAVGSANAALSRRLERRQPWIVLAAAQALAVFVVKGAAPGPTTDWLFRSCIAATCLGLLAACLYVFRSPAGDRRRKASRAMFDTGLALFAFTPFVFASSMPVRLLETQIGALQMPPLPDVIDPTTPLGMVQKLSEQQDRRHYSPAAFLHPNWSEALGILDMLSLSALYPVGYHELNAGLFKHWNRDPVHGLIPDRFTPAPAVWAMSKVFQRVMAVHRISLLTFAHGRAKFAAAPSPYEATNCQLLARSDVQGTESYVCPQVGGVGYFPGTVSVVQSRAQALDQLSHLSAHELLDTVLLGPEVDLSIGTASAALEPRPAKGRVSSVRRWGDDLTYQLEVELGGMFVIADTYFRGWSAMVNGQRAGISRANVAFKAVRVPAGRVALKLHFSPVLL